MDATHIKELGWEPKIDLEQGIKGPYISEDITYKAKFSSSINLYKITWLNDNGEVIKEDLDVPYGTVPSYSGEIPTKEADAQYTYTFSCWDKAFEPITGDTTFTAVYSTTTNKYTYTFLDEDGTLLKSETVILRNKERRTIWQIYQIFYCN